MSSRKKRDHQIRNNPVNVRFQEAINWLQDNGFKSDRISGSHHVFYNAQTKERLNFQPDASGKAKAYQLRQAIKAIDKT